MEYLKPIELKNKRDITTKVLAEYYKKVTEIDSRVKKLENTMTIDYSQQEVIRRAASERVIEILGGKHTIAYKELRKKVFFDLWKRYKRIFYISGYRDTAKKDYDKAIEYIVSWEPSKDIEYRIIELNSMVKSNN